MIRRILEYPSLSFHAYINILGAGVIIKTEKLALVQNL